MKTLPWDYDGTDFEPDDFNYEISRPYRLWFEFLRLSPTYELAARYYRTQCLENGFPVNSINRPLLSYEESNSLDHETLNQVVKTYLAFGEVNYITFKAWWPIVSKSLFGVSSIEPKVVKIGELSYCEHTNPRQINKNIYELFDKGILSNTGYKLFAIPLDGSKDDLLASVSNLLNEDDFRPVRFTSHNYYFSGERLRIDGLEKKLRLLWSVANNPEIDQWMCGIVSDISPTKTKEFKKNPDDFIERHLNNFKTTVSRDLKDAKLIVENAARGKFPSTHAPCSKIHIDAIRQCMFNRIELRVHPDKWGDEMKKVIEDLMKLDVPSVEMFGKHRGYHWKQAAVEQEFLLDTILKTNPKKS
jgi:hypothetical protein